MKNLIKISVALMVVSLSILNAVKHHTSEHADHDHKHDMKHKHGPGQEGDSKFAVQMEASKDSIEHNAMLKIKNLVLKHKIPKSWTSIKIDKTEKTTNNTNDWVVCFNNIKIKKKSKQNLYIFVSIYGEVMGVNYTGK